MKIEVSSFENNRPVIYTYEISDEPVAEAVSSNKIGCFDVKEKLDAKLEYAIMDQEGNFVGMIMVDESGRGYRTTIPHEEWEQETPFCVHGVCEIDKRSNY